MKLKLPLSPGGRCRLCFNEHYGTKLEPRDCYYEMVRGQCTQCGEVKNIIIGFSLKGKIKLFFTKKKVYYIDIPDEVEDENINEGEN